MPSSSAATALTRGPRPALGIGVLIACAVCCAALAMGLRNSAGLFLAPVTAAHAWTASGFALAIALQVLINGASQPLWGQLADRIGGRRVIMFGALLQGLAVVGMALSADLGLFTFFAGVLMGVAVSAAGMPIIIASLTRLLPEEKRGRATGLGTAGSSFGQFLVVPVVQLAISGFGWQAAMLLVAAASLLMIPLALPLNDSPATAKPSAGPQDERPARQAVAESLRDPTFWCLSAGAYVCGLHVSFMGVHLPAFVASCHLPVAVGAGAVSVIGLFNIAGSLISGELTQRWKRRELLVGIFAARAVLITWFLMAEKTTATVLIFAALMGILWLSTVPPQVALCARNFGTRWLATIFGLVFFAHQIGGFTGAWLGGVIFDRTGSYDLMWQIAILASAFAAVVHMPMRDGPRRAVLAPA